MDRKKEQIERYRYEFERDGVSTAGLAARRQRKSRRPLRASRVLSSPTTRPKSTWPWWKRCARA